MAEEIETVSTPLWRWLSSDRFDPLVGLVVEVHCVLLKNHSFMRLAVTVQ